MDLIEWLKSFVVIEELDEESVQEETEEHYETNEVSRKQKRIAVFEPRDYKDAIRIADVILDGSDAAINLTRLDKRSRRRLTDFLCGVAYHSGCEISITGNEVLVCYWENSEDR